MYNKKSLGYLDELVEKYADIDVCKDEIFTAFEIITKAYRDNKKILICGNGGSAADAEHIVGELMKEFYIKRPLEEKAKERLLACGDDGLLAENLQGSLPAIALTGNLSLSTAYANDATPELVFAQQVYGYGVVGDVLLAISTSGNSTNVLAAITTAKAKGLKVVGLTGKIGGKMSQVCDVCIKAPRSETFEIQELHLPIYHCLCRMIEGEFFE